MSDITELYQQMIIEHNKKPRNFRKIENPTHQAEGFNPLCGDHYHVYLNVDNEGKISDVSFEGTGCAISKSSASMMTGALKGKSTDQATDLFERFHKLLTGELDSSEMSNLEKLKIFSGIWKYPSRVKCASLCWHTMKNALSGIKTAKTE